MKKPELNTLLKVTGWALVGAGTLVKAMIDKKEGEKAMDERFEKFIEKKLKDQ